jgi:hypothetical protein
MLIRWRKTGGRIVIMHKAIVRMVLLVLVLAGLSGCGPWNDFVRWVDSGPGLRAYYPFDGNADDESANGNHGTVHGAVLVPDRHGLPDSAYSFDGVDDYIEVADSRGLSPQDAITITAWVYLRSFSTSWPPVVKKNGSGGSEYTGYSLDCTISGPHVVFYTCLDGPEPVAQSGGVSFPLGRWNFVVAIYDGTTCRVYLNGDLGSSQPYTGAMVAATNAFFIGHDPYNTDRYFDGMIDDVRVFDRALAPFEIDRLYY